MKHLQGSRGVSSGSWVHGSWKRPLTPDFDRPPIAGGDDPSPIVVVGDRRDSAVMGAGFLALELECGCVEKQERSDLAKERRFWAASAPESQTLIVLSDDPETILLPSGENETDMT